MSQCCRHEKKESALLQFSSGGREWERQSSLLRVPGRYGRKSAFLVIREETCDWQAACGGLSIFPESFALSKAYFLPCFKSHISSIVWVENVKPQAVFLYL